jgi:glycosyltransferase involved in cell wall biosynthesis
MRILILVHGYPPSFTGGAELRAERTARALAAHRHQVVVLCIESLTAPASRLVASEQPQDGVQIYRLHVQPGAEAEAARQAHTRRAIDGALTQLIHTWRPEVIHLFSGYLMGNGVIDVAVAHQIPVVVSLTDYWWLCHRINLLRTDGTRCDGPTAVSCARCYNEMYRRFRLPALVARPLADRLWLLAGELPALGERLGVPEQAERLEVMLAALTRANALISPSQFLADLYIRYGVSRERVHVWRQGVNLGLCPLRTRSPTLRFGYFGQIKHHKGVHTLVEAWGRLRSPRERSLAIYGSDHGEAAYGGRVRELARLIDDITWARPIRHSEIWQTLAQIDVLVVPSRWNENSPNVILEAQAMGVVVVGSNLGGVAELVRHGHNGLLFAPDDPADLAAQLGRLLDEPGLVASLRRNPIPFQSFEAEIAQIEGLYERLVPSAERLPALDEIVLR